MVEWLQFNVFNIEIEKENSQSTNIQVYRTVMPVYT